MPRALNCLVVLAERHPLATPPRWCSTCLTAEIAGVVRLQVLLPDVRRVWCSLANRCQLSQGSAMRTSRRSKSTVQIEGPEDLPTITTTPASHIPCRINNTQRTTFITAVSRGPTEEALRQVATITTTTRTTTTARVADYFISDRVGELCSLLSLRRFEPHVLQVCSPLEHLTLYERTQPSLSIQCSS